MNYGLYNPIQQHEGTPPYFLELSFLVSKTKINIKMKGNEMDKFLGRHKILKPTKRNRKSE